MKTSGATAERAQFEKLMGTAALDVEVIPAVDRLSHARRIAYCLVHHPDGAGASPPTREPVAALPQSPAGRRSETGG